MLTSDANTAKKAGKAFIIGEFDWNDANRGDSLSSFVSAIESKSSVTGDLFWELWPHADDYSYVHHEIIYDLHYPGDSDAMRASVAQLRVHAYKMAGLLVPPYSSPGIPLLEMIIREGTENALVWRGATKASSYSVERSIVGVSGPWAVICNQCATDSSIPWVDATPPAGILWYRVIAYNLAGVAGSPSNSYQAGSAHILIDNLDDWSKTFAHSSNLTLDMTNSQYMHDDMSRATRTTTSHEYIIWKEDNIISFQAITYFWPSEPVSHFSIYTSLDESTWMFSNPEIIKIDGDWLEYIYTLNNMPGVNYVKIVWNNTTGQPWNPQLGAVTILY